MLVCGDGGAVGLNMEWATTIIHWDLYGGAENIAQRSWRLDRRIESFDKPKEINNSVKTFIFREFNVHYYTCQESDKIADYNESYRRNRVFLGDYRFIDGKQDEQLIPKEANLAEFNSAKLSLNPIKFFSSFNVNLFATKANSIAFFEKIGFVGTESMDKELLSFFAGEITTNI